MPNISVVLCTYAGEKARNLDEAIESVFSQTRVPDELVIVQDGPIPESQKVVIGKYVETYPQIIRVESLEVGVGRGLARNHGITMSAGKLVAIMDSDDIASPDRLRLQEEFIVQKGVDIVAGWQSEFDGDPSNVVAVKKCPPTHNAIVRSLKFRCRIPNPSIMFDKQIFLQTGGYGDYPHINEDHDFFVKIAEAGGVFGVIEQPLINVRISRDQRKRRGICVLADDFKFRYSLYKRGYYSFLEFICYFTCVTGFRAMPVPLKELFYKIAR